ncbi:MAG: hypothetical protein AB1531_02790 [Chloroflexota bacterium]
MDHRPFEDWLSNEEPLTPQQKRDLTAHLQTCRSCSSLAEVDLAFRSVRQAEPAREFVNRFQVRLAARKQALRRRNALGFLVLAVSVVGLLAGLAWPFIKTAVASPVDTLAAWLSSLVNLWASFQALIHAGLVLFRVAPGFVPAYIWAVLLFGLTGWSLVWVLSLMKYTRIPQGA